jgi:hypothetical protein
MKTTVKTSSRNHPTNGRLCKSAKASAAVSGAPPITGNSIAVTIE